MSLKNQVGESHSEPWDGKARMQFCALAHLKGSLSGGVNWDRTEDILEEPQSRLAYKNGQIETKET